MKHSRTALLLAGIGLLAACQTTETLPPTAEAVGAKVRNKVQASMIDAARASEQRDDIGSAIAYYRSAYERDPKAVEAAVGLSRNLRRANRSREAVIIAERGLEVHNREPRLMAELGKAQLASDETLQAIETLSRAGALMPQDWEIPSAIGVAYDRLGRYEDAERWYRRAQKLEPSNPIVLNNYALSLAQSGKLREAIAALERASAMPESGPRIRQNLALMYALLYPRKAHQIKRPIFSSRLIPTERISRRSASAFTIARATSGRLSTPGSVENSSLPSSASETVRTPGRPCMVSTRPAASPAT